MPTGTIARVFLTRGFGFILGADGRDDVFLHAGALPEGEWERLRQGTEIEYEVKDTPKGPRVTTARIAPKRAEFRATEAK